MLFRKRGYLRSYKSGKRLKKCMEGSNYDKGF